MGHLMVAVEPAEPHRWLCPSETDCSLSTVASTAATAVAIGRKLIEQHEMLVRVPVVAAVVA